MELGPVGLLTFLPGLYDPQGEMLMASEEDVMFSESVSIPPIRFDDAKAVIRTLQFGYSAGEYHPLDALNITITHLHKTLPKGKALPKVAELLHSWAIFFNGCGERPNDPMETWGAKDVYLALHKRKRIVSQPTQELKPIEI